MQGVHYGEEKHHVKLSKDTSDYGRINERSETTLSASRDDHSAANASTHGSSTLGPSLISAETASPDQADAHQQVHTQFTTIKDGNGASSWSHYSSPRGEKDNAAVGVNVPAVSLPYPRSERTLRDSSPSKDEDKPKTPDEDEVASSPYPEGGLRAWLVVFGSFSGMTASFGVLNMAGTFQAYLSTHQLANESPSSIGWIFSLYAFLTFFCGVQIGPVFDAKGPRWLVAAGSVLLFAGMMGTAASTKLWHFILTYSILCGLASSLIFTPAVGAVAHFFSKRRGVATGLAATGGSIGGTNTPIRAHLPLSPPKTSIEHWLTFPRHRLSPRAPTPLPHPRLQMGRPCPSLHIPLPPPPRQPPNPLEPQDRPPQKQHPNERHLARLPHLQAQSLRPHNRRRLLHRMGPLHPPLLHLLLRNRKRHK
ncbi:hypothetical protein N7G274_007908 [Stereocaulon virgatum]|uniref:Major facilitator superfamily (MFS) profile domain-containing protein n=1 Tax=Stereocaulon virgatum TaxID=373712 RepID=A0ABR4A2G3_9LECA